jgi:DNA polymerase-3 subunit alpha (Gram-positive type)
MQLALEMLARGLCFLPVGIRASHGSMFLVEDGRLRMPFSAINGVGENAAAALAAAREKLGTTLFSAEDVIVDAGINKTVADVLYANDVFGDLPRSNQLSLFDD